MNAHLALLRWVSLCLGSFPPPIRPWSRRLSSPASPKTVLTLSSRPSLSPQACAIARASYGLLTRHRGPARRPQGLRNHFAQYGNVLRAEVVTERSGGPTPPRPIALHPDRPRLGLARPSWIFFYFTLA